MTVTSICGRLRRRVLPAHGSGDRGMATIQMVLLLPAVLAVLFAGMQAALWYHARAVAIAAAQEGARAAGAQYGTAGAGTVEAAGLLADAGPGVISATSVHSSRSATTATVTVSGSSMSVIPGWTIAVHQSATVPVERITG
ncbi:hypothetical protein GCM10011492_09630 [Flexivirga endophytica]|uniref:TadE-like domain-containing protein n=1 Tax=Flexivirga endophytica TaxID=1849103 RepID=A0A916SY80_9MICO|nr:TadE/TadG family type IV pilus assembly protein [Flexivirga endophytica]GGB21808.1 hypothetical protein GCM10011492_09630 [Flexivirga endophytica]GHB59424.1 hypothetical protein GCM10008112_30650 [Flexivirga endophytica]